ncbi:MAG: hypothetical protein LBT24_07265 [Tannerella sp.]|jgi:hypothetical protein|nr:hypothetical protein [Tannerella sp.]
MDTIQGVIFEKEIETNKRYVRVDFDRYGKVMIPFLEQIGAIDQKDDFRKEYATAITGDELRQRMYKTIDAWEWKKK